jgi:predicted acylesterase/phospholipase RssA
MDGALDPKTATEQSTTAAVPPLLGLPKLLTYEVDRVRKRKKLTAEEPLIAVALSGGGVRSATVSLGFLKELQTAQLLSHVDYLSSVSGGGYASGYLFAAAEVYKEDRERQEIFGEAAHQQLVQGGQYLATGRGWKSYYRGARLLGSFISTGLLNWSWLLALVVLLGALTDASHRAILIGFLGVDPEEARVAKVYGLLGWVLLTCGSVAVLRLVLLGTLAPFARLANRFYSPVGGLARALLTLFGKGINWLEGAALLAAALSLLVLGVAPALYAWVNPPCVFFCRWVAGGGTGEILTVTALFVLFGLLASADVIGLNAVFRNLIDSAYLKAPHRSYESGSSQGRGVGRSDLLLKDAASDPKLPYPLFNCGLYLHADRTASKQTAQGPHVTEGHARPSGGQRLKVGTQMMDYFVFSPMFCGSQATSYAATRLAPYAATTVADAVACSAASLSPLMEGGQNRFLSFLFSLLNLNLGAWLPNPNPKARSWSKLLRFWPATYLRMVFGKLSKKSGLVHVADGGFIDNLGVVELLRRRCRIIIAVDNTYDPNYEFKHLRNLVARARAEPEMLLNIEFGVDLKDSLRPNPVTGFAKRDHLVARVSDAQGFEGYLIYIKACLTTPLADDEVCDEETRAASYQAYHPRFPQESTADQFFDPDQWNAYNMLGRKLARSAVASMGRASASVDRTRLLEALAARHSATIRQEHA